MQSRRHQVATAREPEAFFRHEYALNYALHQYKKPILAWGHNVVMGGGLGLLGACSHRVGTRQTRIAMPEITIGLFPDAGGSWYLSRMRSRLGYFMGLTGCQLAAGDAVSLGLVNHLIEHESKAAVLDGLGNLKWTRDPTRNRQCLTEHLYPYEIDDGALSENVLPVNLLRFEDRIDALLHACLNAADDAVENSTGQYQYDFFDAFERGLDALPKDKWLDQAKETYRNGCPMTAHIFLEQMCRCEGMTLEEMFKMELTIAYECLRRPDFPEGVRALLIDKDRSPKWSYPNYQAVPGDEVMEHF